MFYSYFNKVKPDLTKQQSVKLNWFPKTDGCLSMVNTSFKRLVLDDKLVNKGDSSITSDITFKAKVFLT